MNQVNETARTYSFPSRVARVGEDLVLTTRDYFVILTKEEVEDIIEKVIKQNKTVMLHKDSLIVFMKEGMVIFEYKRKDDFQRVLMVKPSSFV